MARARKPLSKEHARLLRREAAVPNELLHQFRSPDDLKTRLREATGVSARTADAILKSYPDGMGLDEATAEGLRAAGATAAQAKKIRAAFGMVRACDELCQEVTKGTQITQPSDVARMLANTIGNKEQEYFVAILLDARQRVQALLAVAVGSLSQVDVHPRELFRDAIRHRAHSIILAHNHPSGSAEPSQADLDLTVRMVEAGKLVGIPVLDHIVTTKRGTTSLASAGLMG